MQVVVDDCIRLTRHRTERLPDDFAVVLCEGDKRTSELYRPRPSVRKGLEFRDHRDQLHAGKVGRERKELEVASPIEGPADELQWRIDGRDRGGHNGFSDDACPVARGVVEAPSSGQEQEAVALTQVVDLSASQGRKGHPAGSEHPRECLSLADDQEVARHKMTLTRIGWGIA